MTGGIQETLCLLLAAQTEVEIDGTGEVKGGRWHLQSRVVGLFLTTSRPVRRWSTRRTAEAFALNGCLEGSHGSSDADLFLLLSEHGGIIFYIASMNFLHSCCHFISLNRSQSWPLLGMCRQRTAVGSWCFTTRFRETALILSFRFLPIKLRQRPIVCLLPSRLTRSKRLRTHCNSVGTTSLPPSVQVLRPGNESLPTFEQPEVLKSVVSAAARSCAVTCRQISSHVCFY